MNDFLRLLQKANTLANEQETDYETKTRVAIVTNFTDDLCKKLLTGLCLEEKIYPTVFTVPYGQYQFQLKDLQSDLFAFQAEVTFVFFDVTPFLSSEFTSDLDHGRRIIEDLRRYSQINGRTIVINTFAIPTQTPHGNLAKENIVVKLVREFNLALEGIAAEQKNVHLCDTNRLMQLIGERQARDLRGMYAFRQPFSHAFLLALTREWVAYLRAQLGKGRKCIVVDLDNTLWGGVVGEVGPLGITLGPDYPGNAFQNFQRVLLEYYQRGIILAVNSRNNLEDVQEVFAKNPHMLLNETHFSALSINWKTKAENLVEIAKELNIGLNSLVFLDDDAMNRDLVRTQLPDVLVPDFSLAPEEYAHALLQLDVFHQLHLTEEDTMRGQMYAEERQRKVVQASTQTIEQYLAQLEIKVEPGLNVAGLGPRLAQLTQKTNQFNLTTRRYTEQDVFCRMGTGLVFSGNVSDKFGSYGITVEAIVDPIDQQTAQLDTFLMSCRVMGRGVERAFFTMVANELVKRGFTTLQLLFIPSAKNKPAEAFLSELGAQEIVGDDGTRTSALSLAAYLDAEQTRPPSFIQILPLIS